MPILRRIALLSLLIAQASCAGGQPSRTGPSVVRFDGVYRGMQTSAPYGGPGCPAVSKAVHFDVAEGRILTDKHNRHRRMEGTVDPDGSVAMQDDRGQRQVFGTILNGRFTASETSPASSRGSSYVRINGATSCTTQIDATRASAPEAADPDP